MSFRKVTTFEEFISLHEKYATFFLLKNSTTCPISHEAFKETEKYATENNEVPVFYLNVQESRPLSNEIADRYEVKHESPQLLLFHGNKVAWHESHWKVTKKSMEEAWASLNN